MSNAQAFLAKVLPWSKDPAASAFFNLHYTVANKNGGKPWWEARACVNLTEMGKTLAWIQRRSDVRDIYVCMSSQKTCENKIGKTGYTYRKGIRNAANALELKSLFVDVDVKPGAYATTVDALTAFKQFINDSKLPWPHAFVFTGSGGFHVHWVLDQALPAAQWQPMAHALAHAVQKHGLKADTQCTIDSARILRVPDTKNFKHDPAHDVRLGTILPGEVTVAQMKAALSPYLDLTKPVSAPHGQIIVGSELGAGIGGAVPRNIDDVAKECAFIDNALKTGGANHDNALWYLGTSIAVHCTSARTTAHRLGNKHATYTPDSTDNQYYRVKASHEKKGVGWPQCVTISAAGASECKSCPHFDEHKSPLNFAKLPAPVIQPAAKSNAAPVLPPLPPGARRDADNRIYFSKLDKDGTTIEQMIFKYPVTEAWIKLGPPDELHFMTVTSVGKAPTEVIIKTTDCKSQNDLVGALSHYSVLVPRPKKAVVEDFFLAWIDKLRETKENVISGGGALGWDPSGFVFGGRLWTPTGDRPAACDDVVTTKRYTPTGTLAAWQAATRLIVDQKRPALDAILASAFAAPFVKLTGESGALFSVFSTETGAHKTTAMRIATAVWGNDESRQTSDDTAISMSIRMTKAPSLPVFYDEIKKGQMKDFANRVFRLTSGVGKSRANPDASLKASGIWSTMVVSTCNDTLIPYVNEAAGSSSAGLARLFEGVVSPPTTGTGLLAANEVATLITQLETNYGQAGYVYAQFLGRNHVGIKQAFLKFYGDVQKRYGGNSSERFWMVTIASLLFGAQVAKRCGLVDIPITPLGNFLDETLMRMRHHMADNPVDASRKDVVSEALQQFFIDMQTRYTLETDYVLTRTGRTPHNLNPITPNSPVNQPLINAMPANPKLERVSVQRGRLDNKYRINRKHFEAWLEKNNYAYSSVVEGIKAKFNAKTLQATLGSGTPFRTGRVSCIDIDANDPVCQDFFNLD